MNPRYLRPSFGIPRVFLYRDAVDFRKQINGLAAIVELELGHNPFDGGLYVFTNRAHNKVKCLMWEENSFVLYYKVLAEERFKWPKPDDEVVSLTGTQINGLLDGYDLALMQGHKTLYYDSVF